MPPIPPPATTEFTRWSDDFHYHRRHNLSCLPATTEFISVERVIFTTTAATT